MPSVIDESWLGRRIVVRSASGRSEDGRIQFSDQTGDLLELDAEHAVLETTSGLTTVPLAYVATARVVEAAAAQVLALQEICTRGWQPAETAWLGGWLLRADAGFTQRANSVLPLKTLGMPVADAIEQATAWYAERGLPLAFSVPTEARRLLDAELGERGWYPSTEAHVMVTRLDRLQRALDEVTPTASVTLAPAATDRWRPLYKDGKLPESGLALLNRHDRARFAEIEVDGELVAIGRGVVDEEWLGISAIEVAPTHRRQGLALAILRALAAWGATQGARRAYLQVSVDNTSAITLYERLGFWVHHDYRYRADPQKSPIES